MHFPVDQQRGEWHVESAGRSSDQVMNEKNPVNTNALTNPAVKAAIEALRSGDRKAWSALFEPNARLYDDGAPRSLEKFTQNALGHERFTSIDRVENNGLDLTGAFHSDQWGDFRTYFRFQLSPSGKIKRLDIGQAD
jgi:hypothetical protein